MKSFTAAEAKRRFGEMLKCADALPLEITRHGSRRRYVLMSWPMFELYEYVRREHTEEHVLATRQSALATGDGAAAFKRVRIGGRAMHRFLAATEEKG